MDVVFSYNNKEVVNIHSKAEHYKNIGLLKSKKNPVDEIKNIKTRYLTMTRSQLQNQNGSDLQNIEEILELTDVEKLEKQLSEDYAKNYNQMINQPKNQTNIKNYQQIINDFAGYVKDDNKKEALNSLDQLLQLFGSNLKELKMLNEITKQQKEYEHIAELNELLRFDHFLAQLNDKNKSRRTSIKYFTSNITPVSEFAPVIAEQTQNWADQTVLKQIKERGQMIGEKQGRATIVFENGQKKELTRLKASDSYVNGQHVTYHTNIFPKDNQLTIKHELIFDNIINYLTIKNYRSEKNEALKMVSFSKKNSFIKEALAQLYNLNNNNERYKIYNGLAFKKGEVIKDGQLEQNFRIIRRDIAINFAEMFLVGADKNQAPRILIYNFKAIPIISIIEAIINNIDKMLRNNKDSASLSQGAFFSVAFTKTDINHWEGGAKRSNKYKLQRIEKAIKGIDQMKMQGELKATTLKNLNIKPQDMIPLINS